MSTKFPPQGSYTPTFLTTSATSDVEEYTTSAPYVATNTRVTVTLRKLGIVVGFASAMEKINTAGIQAYMRVAIYDSAGILKAAGESGGTTITTYTEVTALAVASLPPDTYTVRIEYGAAGGYTAYINRKRLYIFAIY